MEEERPDNAKYKRLSIQRKTGVQVGREICRTIQNRRNSIIKCSEVVVTKLNENSSGSQCELDSMVQETDKRTEKGRRETCRGQRN